MSDLSRVEQILAAKAAGTTWDGIPLSRLEEELLSIDFSKEPVVVESFSEMTEPGVIYIMRTGSSGGKDIYEEFILVDGVPEKLGHNVDIDAYTKAETDDLLSEKVDKEEGKGLFSGSYNDLTNKPSIPDAYTKAETDDLLSEKVDKEEGKGLFSGSYNDLTNKPSIPDAYTKDKTDDLLSEKVDKEEGKGLFSGKYNDLSGKPSIPDAYTKDKTDDLLSEKVDKEEGKGLFSGSYNDLTNKPSIPITTTTAITLSTSGWSSGIYNLEKMWPSSTYNIQVDLYESTTAAQATAWQNAQIVGSVTNNRLKALGTVPTVAIPVMVTATTK